MTNKKKALNEKSLSKVSGGNGLFVDIACDKVSEMFPALSWLNNHMEEILNLIRIENPSKFTNTLSNELSKKTMTGISIDEFKKYIYEKYNVSVYNLD